MAVNTVASVILRKLSELLGKLSGDGDTPFQFRACELERDALEKMSIDAYKDEEEDLEYIKKWVDVYLRNLHRGSESVMEYLLLIEADKQRVEYIMEHGYFFNRFTAPKILSQKLKQVYRMLFIRMFGSSSVLKHEGKEFGKLKVPSERRGKEFGKLKVPPEFAWSPEGRERVTVDTVILENLRDMLSRESLLEKQSSSLSKEPDYREKQSSILIDDYRGGKKFEKQSSIDYRGGKILNEFEKLRVPTERGKEFEKLKIPIKEERTALHSMEFGGVGMSDRIKRRLRVFRSKREIIDFRLQMKERIIDIGMLENTIDIIISQADIIIHTDEEEEEEEEEDIEPIKIWVDDYIRNIQHGSSSFLSYFYRIKRDMGRLAKLDYLLMYSDYHSLTYDSWLTIIIAWMILRERECQLWQIFSVDLNERLADPKVLRDAEYLYYKLEDDLSLVRPIRDTAADDLVIGDLRVTNKIIGRGSHGSVVFEGYYHNHLVAVKRLRKSHHSKCHLEFYEHPNLITCFGMVSDRNNYYISLELCMCSLYDLIMRNENNLELWSNGFPSPLLKSLMCDIVSGLAHLHTLNIVLVNLNPRRVLVTKPTTAARATAKISKIGLSRELIGDSTGWQTVGVSRWSANVDLFSLGYILFFCITQGKHPYGEDWERYANIVKDNKDLSLIQNSPEAVDLISRLLNSDPELRPKAREVIHHLFFWDSKMLEAFLHDISNDLESEGQNSQLLQTLEGVLGGEKWTEKINQRFLKKRNKHRQSCRYTDSVQDLLRLIRNSLEHYNNFAEWTKRILGGSSPEGVLAYFRTQFPKLFVGVHKVIWEHCAEEERLYGDKAKWKWKWKWNQRSDGPNA